VAQANRAFPTTIAETVGIFSMAAPIYNNMSYCDEDNYAGGGTNLAQISFTVTYYFAGNLQVNCGDAYGDSANAYLGLNVEANIYDLTTNSFVFSPSASLGGGYDSISCTSSGGSSASYQITPNPTTTVYNSGFFTLYANNVYSFVVMGDAINGGVVTANDASTYAYSQSSQLQIDTSTVSCGLC
jgi:hypothetical protein